MRPRFKIKEEVECMGIVVNLDVMLAKRKMRSNQLAEKVGITEQNLSVLKNGKAKAIRLSTLEAICIHLQCQPGDILEYRLEVE
jgi:putative transcriptional regulator